MCASVICISGTGALACVNAPIVWEEQEPLHVRKRGKATVEVSMTSKDKVRPYIFAFLGYLCWCDRWRGGYFGGTAEGRRRSSWAGPHLLHRARLRCRLQP